MKRRILPALACLFALTASGCTYHSVEEEWPCRVVETVSFASHIQPLLQESCATPGCHVGPYSGGGLDLNAEVAYANLLAPGRGYVDTVHPDWSIFYVQLNSTANPMPPSGRLDSCTIALVLKWIETGAPNN